MWLYATRGFRLVDPGIDRRIILALTRTILIGSGITFVGFALSFYAPIASILGFFAMFFMIAMTAHAKHGIVS
jgi:hypothetical protein